MVLTRSQMRALREKGDPEGLRYVQLDGSGKKAEPAPERRGNGSTKAIRLPVVDKASSSNRAAAVRLPVTLQSPNQ